MKQIALILLAFTIVCSCKSRVEEIHFTTETLDVPCEVYNLPMRKSIKFNSNESFTIDLKDITDSVTWIYTDRLDDCFSYDNVPWKLSIDTKEELLSAKLFVNYLPTIWADENDWVLQFIQFSSLRSVGTKDVIIDSEHTVLLNSKDLDMLPEDVVSDMSGITKEDLLIALEATGNDFECKNWNKEKPVWERYISKYQPGDFLDVNNRKFGVYPNTFVLQLILGSKQDYHVVNLCDKVIIGN